MNVLHVCAGWEETNGAAVIARLVAREQVARGDTVSFSTWASPRALRCADEVWVHCGWLPCLWWAGLLARRSVRMPEACYDPVRLAYRGWKKRLVGPIERFFLRRAERIVVTCDAEREWVERYLGKRHPPIEVKDIKKFFDLKRWRREGQERRESGRSLHLLYLGRRHPLKGVEFLERAVGEVNVSAPGKVELRIESSLVGEEKERAWEWCDALVLPTLSENFGLVVAEALERGKRVITTDGAPVWRGQPGVAYVEGFRDGADDSRVRLLCAAIMEVCDA
ncbi:MAG: hypothetical protein IJH50_06650 [Kiritimatiellae bacterium]|nr:hypothetical protein [Kiritimatiellia bacterium]